MKSLAVVVSILFYTAIFGGLLAWGLAHIKSKSRNGALARRFAVTILGIWGILNGFEFAIAPVQLLPRFVGVFSIAMSTLALRKEFGFWQKPPSK